MADYMNNESITEMLNRLSGNTNNTPQVSDFDINKNNFSSLMGQGEGMFRPPSQVDVPAAPSADEPSWLDGLGGMDGIASGMKGLSSLGNFGLGIANYFTNKSNFDKMMRFQKANFQEQKNAAALNAGNERDRLNRISGINISPRTEAAYDKVLPRI